MTRDQMVDFGESYIVIYSITSNSSVKFAETLLQQIKEYRGGHQFPVVIVGNKADLDVQRQVKMADGQKLAKIWDAAFLECSSFNIDNINKVFSQLIRQVLKYGDRKSSPEIPRTMLKFYKIYVLGSEGVGKTTLITSFVKNDLWPASDTHCEEEYFREYEVDGQGYSLQIIDTPAFCNDTCRDLESDISTAEGFIVVYCIIRPESILDAEQFLVNEISYREYGFPLVLVGNMLDLESMRVVSSVDGQNLAHSWGGAYMEVSALNPEEAEPVFERMVREIRKFEQRSKSVLARSKNTLQICCSVL